MSNSSRTCVATNGQGEPCQAAPLTDSEFCFTHDPSRALERANARRRGGRNSSRAGSVVGSLVQPVQLRSMAAIQAQLEAVVTDTLHQANSAQRSRTLGSLLSLAMKALEVGELEGRLAALEARFAEGVRHDWRAA